MLAEYAANQVFKRFDKLHSGKLVLHTPDGRMRAFEGAHEGPTVSLSIYDWSVLTNVVRRGNVGLADDYRAGKWETDDLAGLVKLGLANQEALKSMVIGAPLFRKLSSLKYLLRLNTLAGSKRNIHAHYDLGNDFYSQWLDPSMTYSSALYKDDKETLQLAQMNKYDRIVERLEAPSGSILEIGCGWGGFAERALERGDYAIKGITLSEEQKAYAQQRLGRSASVALEDYRAQQGKFDRIVSIEMFEAVGEKFWPQYFGQLGSLMKQDGKAVVQTITIKEEDFAKYRHGADFIRTYIFPGGMLPSASAFKASADRAGLKTRNEFFFGQHYAKTLYTWLENFDSRKAEIKSMGYDDGFIRLWRLYLAACAAAFQAGQIDVMQAELVHA